MFLTETYVRFHWICLKGCIVMLGFLDENKWINDYLVGKLETNKNNEIKFVNF